MVNIIVIGLALGVLVTIHEMGHYLMAKAFGVWVDSFSIGFGPVLLKKKIKETEFRISLIPLGGYVAMRDENSQKGDAVRQNSFQACRWWQKALISFAGPAANLVLAFVLFFASFVGGRTFEDQLPVVGKIVNIEQNEQFKINDKIIMLNDLRIKSWGQVVSRLNVEKENKFLIERGGQEIVIIRPATNPMDWYKNYLPKANAQVGEVAPGMPAYSAGLQEDDLITEIDGIVINDWYELRKIIANNKKDAVMIKAMRGDKEFTTKVELQSNVVGDSKKLIGITQKLPVRIDEKYSFSESVRYGALFTYNFTLATYQGLFKLLTKPQAIKDSIGGPIMLYTMSKQSVKKGINSIFTLFASVSVLLMIMNLLPIPVLDGGQIIFAFVEGIMARPLSLALQGVMQRVGLIMLLLIMSFSFYNDFKKVIMRHLSSKKINQIEATN